MDKVLFTFDGEDFTLLDCIGAICTCAFVIAIFAIASTLLSNYSLKGLQ